jgi:D-3-phosphoglycerate dehydrogenase
MSFAKFRKELLNMKAIASMYDAKDYACELAPLVDIGYALDCFRFESENIPAEVLIEAVKGYPYIIAAGEDYSADTLKTLSENGLRMIVRMGVGYDHIDIHAARSMGIDVANTPGANANAVAEQALMLTMAAARALIPSQRAVRTGDWSRRPFPTDLLGAIFGVLGFGNIARSYVRFIQPLAGRVIAYDPYPNIEAAAALGVELVSFDELITSADVISLHLPLTESTRNLIDAAVLRRMKPNLVLVNTSRGGIVNESALYDALKEGRILAAGLDVYAREPLPQDDPLQTLDNCVLMPHNASFTRAAFRNMMIVVVSTLLAHIQGKPVPNIVNR